MPSQSGGVMNVELAHEMFTMFLNGFDADSESCCGLRISLSFGDELDHLTLARGEVDLLEMIDDTRSS